ncbi:universal stress protein [Hymenobacter canadensis]|uniref:Universal stress protein n=1 Tax=Hymenobacter canadensis TaxID=2999067 RepID=A0ABY7LRH3_9BACT|nr:universal stress protein [Hymenobacter canadensis]WBA43018.1 universal stress protein [Hymenobacter canadensis]
MKPNLVVLTDFSAAAERARAYAAALAAPLGAELHLVHAYYPLPLTATEFGVIMPPIDARYVQDTRQALAQVAADMPVPATAELLETDWSGAVVRALNRYHPLLLVAGLTATDGLLDEWLSNRALPLAHETGYPLLLVPEHLPDSALRAPRRLALALEDRPFRLGPAATAVAPLLDALGTDVVAVCVLTPEQQIGGHAGLHALQRSGLSAAIAGCGLHTVMSEWPGPGILQAAQQLSADMVGLLDQGHGWVHKLFHGSVIDHVLRHAQRPVLLLPTMPDSGLPHYPPARPALL